MSQHTMTKLLGQMHKNYESHPYENIWNDTVLICHTRTKYWHNVSIAVNMCTLA